MKIKTLAPFKFGRLPARLPSCVTLAHSPYDAIHRSGPGNPTILSPHSWCVTPHDGIHHSLGGVHLMFSLSTLQLKTAITQTVRLLNQNTNRTT